MITKQDLVEMWHDASVFIPLWFFFAGVVSALLAGIGIGLFFIILFVGIAYKLLTANIW
jgi:hypothetical protein